MERWGFNPGRLEGAGTPFEWPQAIGHGRQPYANILGGPWQLTAGPNGLQLGIFGWADPVTGEVANSLIPGGLLGFVLPVRQMWNWQRVVRANALPGLATQGGLYLTTQSGQAITAQTPPVGPPGMILRPGCECVLAATGDFLTRFPLGGEIGNRVWTDPATGLPYAAPSGQNLATQGGLVITTQGGQALVTEGFVETPWVVMQNGGCNAKLRISSFVKPVN